MSTGERIDVNVSMTERIYAELVNDAAAVGCSLSELVSSRLAAAPEELLACPCGSQWFTLQEGISDKGKHAGAVALNQSGSVAAWSGRIVCIECGQHNALPEPPPPPPSLRLVLPARASYPTPEGNDEGAPT